MVPLTANPLFARLSPAERDSLSGLAQEQTYHAGATIFAQGGPGDGMYLVKSGCVDLTITSNNGRAQVISRAKPGDMFGEMAVLEHKPRSAGAVSAEDTTVYFLPREELSQWLDQTPQGWRVLLCEISGRLRDFNQQYIKEVTQADRLAVIGRFARSIIHDLKNPLNVIGLTAEVACMEGITPEMRLESARRIRKQIERISGLIGEILEFTQSTGNTSVLSRTNFGGFCDSVLPDLGAEAKVREIEFHVENPPPQAFVLLDPRRLRRVFSNLVYNAMDFLKQGDAIIVRFREEPNEVIVEVEDTGPGIAPEIRDRLFEPFATHGKVHGTGLGLSICKRIITDHSGWITVRHEAGKGAIFAFGLPRLLS